MTEQAATKRVSRALAKLRSILERQGVTASEATLSAILPVIALKTGASAALVTTVAGSTSAAAAVSPAAIALARTARSRCGARHRFSPLGAQSRRLPRARTSRWC